MNLHRPSYVPTDRPSAPQAHQYKVTQSTGMATQMPEENRMAARSFREKEKQESRVFFRRYF